MTLRKVKNGDIENTKCEFRGWFYKLVVKVGYFFRKIIKRSPEIAILVKKYEILDFGGSFDKSSGFYRWICHHTPTPLSISPNKFDEMEKMESFLVFKTFFLISKMDKNKCPIFIFKKKFQKMKSLFFYVFFWDIFFAFLHDTW